jgi:hypothetical protein
VELVFFCLRNKAEFSFHKLANPLKISSVKTAPFDRTDVTVLVIN